MKKFWGINRLKVRDIALIWIVVYVFFGIVYLEPNPINWKLSGIVIALLVAFTGTKNQING